MGNLHGHVTNGTINLYIKLKKRRGQMGGIRERYRAISLKDEKRALQILQTINVISTAAQACRNRAQ